MAHESLAMSETAASRAQTARAQIEEALAAVAAKKLEWARLPLREKIALLRACIPTVMAHAEEWVRVSCEAKGLPTNAPIAGEEWLGGPVVTVRNLRLLAETLEQIQRAGTPELGRAVRHRPDGRLVVEVMPASAIDALVFKGFSAEVWLQPGLTEREAREKQASFYKRKDPTGGLTLVLGAGNVSSIAPMDALQKLFAEGFVCLVKMNPVNEYLGPVFEKAFRPLIERDYLRIVYGAGDVGAFLCEHPQVDDIHITGSDRTHDLIVWGPPGEERERRKAAKDPVLKKTISSELGNVSPVVIVPAKMSQKELDFQARNVASQVTNNASFNCNAAKMLVTGKGWAQKEEFFSLLRKHLASVPPRKAYYPGAAERWRTLTQGKQVESIGQAAEGQLPWTIIHGLDPAKDEVQFSVEPFCAILSHVELEAADPAAFVTEAARFCNDRLWGTLNCCLIVHPSLERDARFADALDRAVVDLRYGTVSINHWPALAYGFVTTPWGGHPSATLENIQSGLGWVHNSYMIEGIEKCIVRGPFVVSPKPPWFFDHAKTHEVGPKLAAMQAEPSLLKLPSLLASAISG